MRFRCFMLAIDYVQRKWNVNVMQVFHLYSTWTFNHSDVHLGYCFMIMQTLSKDVIFILVTNMFKMLPECVICPEHDHSTPGGI